MYSDYSLQTEFESIKKINDIKTQYRIHINAAGPLEQEFGDYAKKFYSAAHEIASYLLETGNMDISQLDTYFFPLTFLYRHCLELLLKGIAFQIILDKYEREAFLKYTLHDLETILYEILKKRETNRSEIEINWLGTFFKSISKMDKESDSFRYPFHIKRERDIFNGISYSIDKVFNEQIHIDLVKHANKFEAAYEILNLWYNDKMDEALEWKGLIPVFVESGGDYYGQAVVGYRYLRKDFYPYIKSYIETACHLRSKMVDAMDDRADSSVGETFLFPMCYLYRTTVELALKSAWFEETREDFQTRCKILYKKKHNIIGLWQKLRKWIFDYYNENDAEAYFNKIDKFCEILQSFDRDASIFRYPCNKKLEPYFAQDMTLDYMNVVEIMETLIYAIDGIGTELSIRNEYIDEMCSETEVDYRAETNSYIL